MKELIFEAITLEEAYKMASDKLQCSIADIKFDIIQQPSKGVFGFFSKKAIVKVVKYRHKKYKQEHKKPRIKIQDVSNEIEKLHQDTELNNKQQLKTPKFDKKTENIFDDFYKNDEQKELEESIIKDISEKVNNLFKKACFKIDEIKVSIYDKETVYLEFNGEDAALLIGKEGYRYKALSYILFNWIYEKYGFKIRLEVAQFLQNQELAIDNYLKPVIEVIKKDKYYKTKPLDGILVTIALNKLREVFPNMYIAVKTNEQGQKYILVNEYNKKN
jgi:spoIIIJ-associated protein